MVFHFLFEQSGTFKREAKKLGYEAFDYDLCNDFGETDYQLDIFREIEEAFIGGGSIFDRFSKDDVVMAFFPCVRFSTRFTLSITQTAGHCKGYSDEVKLLNSIKYERSRSGFYTLFCELFIVCLRRGLKLVVENPFSKLGYLHLYFPIKPAFVDVNRRFNGDVFEKPTQYFFVNFEPKNNFIFECGVSYPRKKVLDCSSVERSLITPEYANRFLREFIL